MDPMHCRDLRPGDIMLKVNAKDALSRVISTAQFLRGGAFPNIVHAGVMFDSTYIVEAQGPGVTANDLRVQNKPYRYVVFRCTNGNVARGAGTCAKMMFDIQKRRQNRTHTFQVGSLKKSWKTGGPMEYSLAGAAGSLFKSGSGTALAPPEMDDLLTDILEGRSHRFFCSQFVIYVYQFVAVQCRLSPSVIFAGSDAKVDPSRLATILRSNSMFKVAGQMVPGVR